MIEDDILKEIRATRDAFAQRHGYDLNSMIAYLRKLDELGDKPVVRLAPRRPVFPGDPRPGPAPPSPDGESGSEPA